MLVFPCNLCSARLSAEESQAGQLVRCPTCLTTLRVPEVARVGAAVSSSGGAADSAIDRSAPKPAGKPAGLGVPTSGGGKRYGFNCAYCSSRLEATEAMAGQHGQCPTCGNDIVIPIMDRYGRLIDPMTGKVIKQDPHPVHAYAAAGDRAPLILRQPGGAQNIQCPRCGTVSPITANNCKNCGMPFTMEGTTVEATGSSNGFCVAALVLGIIGIPAFCSVIMPLLAIVFGIIGYTQTNKPESNGAGKGMAIAGIVCGAVGLAILLFSRML